MRTIGIVSTSYPYAIKLAARYERALAHLKDLGFETKTGAHVTTRSGFVTGTPQERAADINTMYADPQVDAILCVNGGSVSSEVLPYLDYSLIRSNPKPIIGYSDATAILLAINAKTGIETCHGPMLIPQYGEYPAVLPYTHSSLLRTLSGEKHLAEPSAQWTDEFLDATKGEDLRPRTLKENPGWKVIKHGEAQGRLICGNLRIICSLLGTPYTPDFKYAILILEDTGIKTDELERNLTHLAHAGVLDAVSGVCFGRMLCQEKDGVSIDDVLDRVFAQHSIPVVTGLDVGHTDPVMTVPVGRMAHLRTDPMQLIIASRA